MPVNARLPEPRSPGDWVSAERCVCGSTYKRFKPGVKFSDGVEMVRIRNGEDGGFRTRGPVLWAMRVIKLELWYYEHQGCGMVATGDNSEDEAPF